MSADALPPIAGRLRRRALARAAGSGQRAAGSGQRAAGRSASNALRGVRGPNPYEHATVDVGRGPVAPSQLWHHETSPYGPLFTLGSYALAPLGAATGLWALKALAGAAALAAAVARGVASGATGP